MIKLTENRPLYPAATETLLGKIAMIRDVYSFSHPDANKGKYLRKPKIDLIAEITNMMMPRKAFEDNL